MQHLFFFFVASVLNLSSSRSFILFEKYLKLLIFLSAENSLNPSSVMPNLLKLEFWDNIFEVLYSINAIYRETRILTICFHYFFTESINLVEVLEMFLFCNIRFLFLFTYSWWIFEHFSCSSLLHHFVLGKISSAIENSHQYFLMIKMKS